MIHYYHDLNSKSLKLMFVLVTYHTFHWTKQLLCSFNNYFPTSKLLVIDNNFCGASKNWHDCGLRKIDNWDIHFDDLCIEESELLRSCPFVIYLPNKTASLTHGTALDIAANWCLVRDYLYLIILEPDCIITGQMWYVNLVLAICSGYNVCSIDCRKDGSVWPAGSIWSLPDLNYKFDIQPKGLDVNTDEYKKLVCTSQMTNFETTTWDVCGKNWYDHARIGKYHKIQTQSDYLHVGNGSYGMSLIQLEG